MTFLVVLCRSDQIRAEYLSYVSNITQASFSVVSSKQTVISEVCSAPGRETGNKMATVAQLLWSCDCHGDRSTYFGHG